MSQTYLVNFGSVTESCNERKNIRYPGFIEDAPALMGEELKASGWVVTDGVAEKTFGEGQNTVQASVALESGEITMIAESTRAVRAPGYSGMDDEREARRAATPKVEEVKTKERENAKQDAAKTILAQEPIIDAEIRAAHGRMISHGLQKKASALGAIQSVTEGVNSDGLAVTTIRVKV